MSNNLDKSEIDKTDDHPEESQNVVISKDTKEVTSKDANKMVESIDSFDDMSFLSFELARGIYSYGFRRPSPIQAKTIHIINHGCDLIAQSHSGTGKTGAFVIGALSKISEKDNYPQVIILANTKGLASQIAKVAENLIRYTNIKLSLCIGGERDKSQHENTKMIPNDVIFKNIKSSHLLIGTPGRMCELIKKRVFHSKKIKTFIMDESDELLRDDFRDQIRNILESLDKSAQMCIFSATYTDDILELTNNFMNNPYKITIEKEVLSLDLIKQYKIDVREERNKFDTLKDLNKKLNISQMIIFVNSVEKAIKLRNNMMDDNFEVGVIHGKMLNHEREDILKQFRLGEFRTLISTDIMSRGIDIDNLKIVINYDVSDNLQSYIHRIGRSGRYGSHGIAINFCTRDDFIKLNKIESHYKIKIDSMPHPDTVNQYLTGIKEPSDKVLSSKNYK